MTGEILLNRKKTRLLFFARLGNEDQSCRNSVPVGRRPVDNSSGGLSTFNVKLREHPSMSFRGHRNWPPVWSCLSTDEKTPIKGELGILKKVEYRDVGDLSVCFLWMEHREREYVGCFVFTDASFAHLVSGLLEVHVGHAIEEIGRLEVRETTLH